VVLDDDRPMHVRVLAARALRGVVSERITGLRVAETTPAALRDALSHPRISQSR
jgi:hypothetical protein